MRKKIIGLVLCLCLSGVVIGCGSSVAANNSIESPEESVQPTPEPTPESTPEPTPEPEPADWLEEHGIAVSPQGDFQCNLYGYAGDASNPTGDFLADMNVSITETTEGVEDGFKKVSALFVINASNNTGDHCKYWSSAFDRYTGTSFEFDNAGTYTLKGDYAAKEGFVAVQNGDEYYDVSIAFETDNQYPILYKTVTVTCPVDYDGTVFQIGYVSPELDEKNSQIDYAARLYTIDELPYYGDGYLYFTMTND